MLRVDATIEHASAQERRLLWRQHNRQWWLIGCILALINLFPPAWLFLPVFSALVFAHFGLESLRQLRAQTIIDARSEEHTSELQSLMRNSYDALCSKKKTTELTHAHHIPCNIKAITTILT